MGFDLGEHGLDPLLEIAAIAGAGEQRAHVEGEDHRTVENLRYLAALDAPRQALGERRLADARITDIERIVLGAAAEHLDGAFDLGVAADERVDPTGLGLGVQIDAKGIERRGTLLDDILLAGVLVGAGDRAARLRLPGDLGDPVRDVVDRVVARHVLLLQEIDRVGFALGEDRHQDVGAGDLVAARGLHVQDGALDHPLESGGGLGLDRLVGGQALQLLVDEALEVAPQPVHVDAARLEDGDGVGVVQEREQEMFQGRELVPPLDGKRQRAVQALLEIAREHALATPSPSCIAAGARCGGRTRRPASPWSRRLRRNRRRRYPPRADARGA